MICNLTDKIKRTFFQAAVASILLYGCTTWTLNKCTEKKLDGNYTRMLQAILNKLWRQHLTKQHLYSHLPPITKTVKIRWIEHMGHCWRSKDELMSDVLLWTPSHGSAKAGRLDRTSVPIWDVALRTCWKQRTIEKGGKRGSGISVLMAWHDDNDEMNTLLVTFQTSQRYFACTQLNGFRYCYLTLTIQFNISHLFAHS